MKTKFFFTDIDGVWTDGSMVYHDNGLESKTFNTYDSAGVIFLRSIGIETVIVTGEKSKCVINRAKKLKIKHVFTGIKDKKILILDFCNEYNVDISNQPYIGDDLNDHEVLKLTNYSYCPYSAPTYTKDLCKYVLQTEGGKGAFRDAVIHFIKLNWNFSEVLKSVQKSYEQ